MNMISNLTPKKFHILLAHFTSPKEIWRASFAELKEIPGFSQSAETFCKHREKANLTKELEEINERGLQLLTLEDEGYPKVLRNLPTPPPVLYMKGAYLEKDELAISIVGTRRCSPYGRLTTERLARELGRIGFTIVSGMALGIDTAAHKGAISAKARTIAVLGSGFGNVYPKENQRLMEEIARNGCVFTEFSMDVLPERWNFPQRNRAISGLSRGTVVVEAPEKSGALITARFALEQGREVFAVPGNITSENSRGAHRLIKDGAKLVENVDDILVEFGDLKEVLSGRGARMVKAERPSLSPLEERVFEALDWEPIHFNDVLEKTGLSTSEISYAILQLQMKDLVQEVAGKRYAKLP